MSPEHEQCPHLHASQPVQLRKAKLQLSNAEEALCAILVAIRWRHQHPPCIFSCSRMAHNQTKSQPKVVGMTRKPDVACQTCILT